MPASATAKRTTSRSSAPAQRPQAAAGEGQQHDRAEGGAQEDRAAQPTRSKSVVASAAPHWTETIEPKTIAAARRV